MMLLRLNSMLLIKGFYLLSVEVSASPKFQVHSHCRGLVNYHDSLSVGVMAGSETVCFLPFHNGYILCVHREIDASSPRKGVLMLAVALKVKGLLINQEPRPFYPYRPYAIGKGIYILSKGYSYIIEIGLKGLPQRYIPYG